MSLKWKNRFPITKKKLSHDQNNRIDPNQRLFHKYKRDLFSKFSTIFSFNNLLLLQLFRGHLTCSA